MSESDNDTSSSNGGGRDNIKGTVKWFNDAKGFGFIEHPSGRDVFVHYSVIEADGFKTLKDGEEVEYEIKEGAKGLHAARVRRTNPPENEAPQSQDTNGLAVTVERGTEQINAGDMNIPHNGESAAAMSASSVGQVSNHSSTHQADSTVTIN